MKGNEKLEIIQSFVAGEVKVLIATTVVEVGVNVELGVKVWVGEGGVWESMALNARAVWVPRAWAVCVRRTSPPP